MIVVIFMEDNPMTQRTQLIRTKTLQFLKWLILYCSLYCRVKKIIAEIFIVIYECKTTNKNTEKLEYLTV